MDLRPDQLAGHISKQGLLPVYFISGDEPLQIMESADLIRSTAREQGFEERVVLNVERGFDWNNLHHESGSMSLFAARKIIEIRMGSSKPGREGGKAFTEYTDDLNPDNLLLVTSQRVDKAATGSKWYKALNSAGACLRIWPVEAARLPGWIQQRARRHQLTLTDDAAQLIASRVEGNMLAASQELERLALLCDNQQVDVADVLAAVSDSARFDPFELSDTLLNGNASRALRILRGLRSEGTSEVFLIWLLVRDIRVLASASVLIAQGQPPGAAMKQVGVMFNRQDSFSNYLRKVRPTQLHEALLMAGKIERMAKGTLQGDAWQALTNLCLFMTGKTIVP